MLLHHPPHVGGARLLRGLQDAGEFEAIIARHGAELVLHGHNHKTSLHRLKGPNGPDARRRRRLGLGQGGRAQARRGLQSVFDRTGAEGVVITARSRGLGEDGEVMDLGAIEI